MKLTDNEKELLINLLIERNVELQKVKSMLSTNERKQAIQDEMNEVQKLMNKILNN